MARQDDHVVRLFVDADGRLTDLLSQLDIETSEAVASIRDTRTGQRNGFEFVEMSDATADEAIVALVREIKTASQIAGSLPKVAKANGKSDLSPSLLAHAVETFGSRRAALEWFSSECGALRNQTPFEAIRAGHGSEVERILACIDYGMLA